MYIVVALVSSFLTWFACCVIVAVEDRSKRFVNVQYCSCGRSLISRDGKDCGGLKNKDLCWICDMEENPDAYIEKNVVRGV